MTLLVRVEVTPFYGQVEISDPSKRDYPRFETGQERAVAIPECIAVATRGDFEGKVIIEVWRERLAIEGVDLQSVFEGELVLTGSGAVVGNTIGNELHPVPLSPGRHRIKVFTSPAGGLAHTVYFLVED